MLATDELSRKEEEENHVNLGSYNWATRGCHTFNIFNIFMTLIMIYTDVKNVGTFEDVSKDLTKSYLLVAYKSLKNSL